jgi:predicted  nucleic acid-binding Zn-ribbon protein
MKQQLAEKQAVLDQAYTKLDALQDQLNNLADAYNAAESREGELEGEILKVQEKISTSEKDLATARVQLEDRLVGMYKDGNDHRRRSCLSHRAFRCAQPDRRG